MNSTATSPSTPARSHERGTSTDLRVRSDSSRPPLLVLAANAAASQELVFNFSATGQSNVVVVDRVAGLQEAVARQRPRAVVLDLSQPGVPDAVTIAHAKAVSDRVPLVAITPDDSRRSAAQAVSAGAQDFISTWNVTPALLHKTVQHAIDRFHALAERRRLLRDLEAMDRGFRRSAEVSRDAIVRVTQPGTGNWITFANEAWERLTGIAASELAGDPERFLAAFVLEDRSLVRAVGFAREPLANRTEVRMLGPTPEAAERRIVLTCVVVPASGDGSPDCILTMQDVTAEREQERALRAALAHERRASRLTRQADQLREVLVQATSHELRTPVTAVLAGAEVLHRFGDQISPASVAAMGGQIAAQARRLHGRVEDLFLLAGAGSVGRGSMADVGESVHDAVRDSQLGDRQVRIHLPATTLVFPEIILRRVLDRLLSNVAQHTPDDTRVCIEVDRIEDRLRLRVSDTGPGLDAAVLARCQTPLAMGASSLDAAQPGMGLGLPVVHLLATSLGGTCEVANVDDGGAVVTVELPSGDENGWCDARGMGGLR